MTEQAPDLTAAPQNDFPRLCKMLYIVFAVSLVLQFFNAYTIVLGSVAVIAGVIVSYLERKKAAGTVYANHLTWLIRTFWIGGSVYLPVVTVLGSLAILFITDHSSIDQALSNPDAGTTAESIAHQFVAANALRMEITMFLFTAPFGAWWLWRCWYGYKRLTRNMAIPNVMRWL